MQHLPSRAAHADLLGLHFPLWWLWHAPRRVPYGIGTLLAQMEANPAAEAILLLGTRHSSELLVGDEFEALAARHAEFRFVPTVNRDESGWDGTRGRVAVSIDKSLVGLSGPDAYFCGPREMTAEPRECLAAAGIAEPWETKPAWCCGVAHIGRLAVISRDTRRYRTLSSLTEPVK